MLFKDLKGGNWFILSSSIDSPDITKIGVIIYSKLNEPVVFPDTADIQKEPCTAVSVFSGNFSVIEDNTEVIWIGK